MALPRLLRLLLMLFTLLPSLAVLTIIISSVMIAHCTTLLQHPEPWQPFATNQPPILYIVENNTKPHVHTVYILETDDVNLLYKKCIPSFHSAVFHISSSTTKHYSSHAHMHFLSKQRPAPSHSHYSSSFLYACGR